MKYLISCLVAVLIMTEGFWHRGSRKKRNSPDEIVPPAFDTSLPTYESCDICISDFIEYAPFLQLHCTVIQDGEVVRGFCRHDLIQFEQNVRSAIRKQFDRLGDDQTDRTVKIWYQNPDDRKFDTNDIPLKIVITFYQPLNMAPKTKAEIKEQIGKLLRELLEVDWAEVNAILKTYCTPERRLTAVLSEISDPLFRETEMLSSTKRILRRLHRDIDFFYEYPGFYGCRGSDSVYENLKPKYAKIDDCYLRRLESDIVRDTIF